MTPGEDARSGFFGVSSMYLLDGSGRCAASSGRRILHGHDSYGFID
jgi:hypothetical protein